MIKFVEMARKHHKQIVALRDKLMRSGINRNALEDRLRAEILKEARSSKLLNIFSKGEEGQVPWLNLMTKEYYKKYQKPTTTVYELC